ncbi:MAG: DUF115 domain-containing protein [Synergistaceae bacterium]|nr:DUF115 domain-containing protein [Synergistaceae bacterium]
MSYKPASKFQGVYHEVVTFLKRNQKVEAFLRSLAVPVFRYRMLQWDRAEKKRRNGYIDPHYTWIKDLKGKYEGKRCFVAGAGPSLTFEDLNAIKDEYSFGVNALILSLDKTEWRPTFYGVSDKYVYERLNTQIESHPELNVFVADEIDTVFSLPDWIKVFPTNLFDYNICRMKNKFCKVVFSDDLYAAVYPAYSVVFAMMQFAVYMGFKEIYLLGCDCNYAQKQQHFIEFDHRNNIPLGDGERLIYTHGKFKEFADSHGVKVINCTRGGMLEVYPRMQLEEVLASPKP